MIYADNAATTKMSPVALAAMLPALEDNYGNPSSLHSVGQHAAELLQSARETMARCLNCKPREILFTSGGSEADNQALLSAAELGRLKGKKHIITTVFEHHAVLHTCADLEKQGFDPPQSTFSTIIGTLRLRCSTTNALNSCVFCGVLSLSADEVTCQPFFLKYLTIPLVLVPV